MNKIEIDAIKLGMKSYQDAKKTQFDFKSFGGFFAFGNDQFDTNKIGNAPYVHIGMGLYCSKSTYKDLLKNLDLFSNNRNEFIKQNILPSSVFAYEFNNHECSLTCDYDEPFKIVEEIYGNFVANAVVNDKDLIKWLNGDDEETDNE
jgi:hypothetical protein